MGRWKHYFFIYKKKTLVCKNSPIFRSPKIGGICEISLIFYEKIVCDDSISRAYFQFMILSEVYRQARGKFYKVSRWKHYFLYKKKKKTLVCKNSPIFRSPKIGGICEISLIFYEKIECNDSISRAYFQYMILSEVYRQARGKFYKVSPH